MRIADSMLELVGRTPMVRLRRLPAAGAAEVVVKIESLNPAGSVKDRVSLAMIEAAERDGRLKPGDTIVEPTSGNTGIGLALVAAVKGYRLVITMPDDSSVERRRVLEHYGATVVLTPAKKLMQGAIDEALAIVGDNRNCFMPQQFDNPANPETHRAHTAREILEDTEDGVDAFVAGVGTGGTITGVGRVLKERSPSVRVVAVEPARSRALSGGPTAPHAIQGIGAGFVPSILDMGVVDEVLACSDEDAHDLAVRLAREEGIAAGLSGGAAVWAALRVAAELGGGRRVVTLIPDGWERYASTAPRGPVVDGLDFII